MKKEELKRIKVWCDCMACGIRQISALKRAAPEEFELVGEFPIDREVQVYSGIENIAEALNQPIYFVTRREYSEKRVDYGEVTFFQIENHAKI